MTDMSEDSGRRSYTGVMEQVLVGIGRIEGRFDSLDLRMRDLETKEAARAAREAIEGSTVVGLKEEVAILKAAALVETTDVNTKARIRKYWYVIIIVAVPVILNIVDTAGDIARGVFGQN